MSFKTTLVLLLLAALVVGLLVFVERDRPGTKELEETAKRVFRDWKADEIVRISIARAGTETAEIVAARERAGAPWRIERPIATEAEDNVFDSMLSTAQYAEWKDALADHDPAALGLDAPRARVTFATADGRERWIAFGKEELGGRHVWAQAQGDARGLLVAKYVETNLVRDLFDLREKDVLEVDRWLVDRVTLRGPAMEIRFKKDGDDWIMDAPEHDYADRERVDALLTALAGLDAKRFVEEAPADLRGYGLDPPLAIVTLEAKGVTHTAHFGMRVPDSGKVAGARPEIYARPGGNGPVVAVEDDLSERIVWSAEHWRSRRIVHPGRDRVTALEVRKPGEEPVRLVRDGALWRFAQPRTATADVTAADDLVRAIEDIEIKKTVREQASNLANFGLDRPIVVAIETAKRRQTFELGRAAAQEGSWYARREGKEAVYEIAFPLAKTLLHAWPALHERRLVRAAAEDVVRLEIARPGVGPRVYVRAPDGAWSAPQEEVDQIAAAELAGKIAALEVAKILPPPENPAAAGLEAPWLTVKATLKPEREGGAPRAVTVEFGKATPERERHARVSAGGVTFYVALPEEAVAAFDRDLKAAPPPPPAPAPQPATETSR